MIMSDFAFNDGKSQQTNETGAPCLNVKQESNEHISLHDAVNNLSEKFWLKEKLTLMNEENEKTTKSLLKIKKDLELYKAELERTLFFINVNLDKQKILTRKKLNSYSDKKKQLQERSAKLCKVSELQELINGNNKLAEEYRTLKNLFEQTKNEYDTMVDKVDHWFKLKVCEMCRLYLAAQRNKGLGINKDDHNVNK